MAPQRNADAAAISPYPYLATRAQLSGPSAGDSSQEGADQGTGRASTSAKGKKGKPKPQRQERSSREEEPKFNTGPRNLRAGLPANRGRRGFRMPGRAYPEDQGVPDYPPPSFLEAINTPPVSVCSSTVSLVAAPPTNIPLVFPPDRSLANISETPHTSEAIQGPVLLSAPEESNRTVVTEEAACPPPPHLIEEPSPATATEVASDSDSESLFIIDIHSVPVCSSDLPRGRSKSKTDWFLRRSGESKTKTGTTPTKQNGDVGAKKRPARPPPLEIDPNPTTDEMKSLESPVSTPKRRLLSLSPLRTMFPPKSPVHHGRAMSAHPLPSPSPYSASRSAFFRSSSSLATALLPSLPSLSSGKSETLTRRLFSYKAKERHASKSPSPPEQAPPKPEDLNRWEMLNKSAYANVDEQGIEHPESLMSAVAAFRSVDTLKDTLGSSPTRSQSFTFGNGSPNNFQARVKFRQSTDTVMDTSELSLRDLKVSSSPAFIDRTLNRKALLSPSTTTLLSRSSEATSLPGAAMSVSHFTSPSTATLVSRTSDLTHIPSSTMSMSNLSLPLTPVRATPPPSTLLAKRVIQQPTMAHSSPLRSNSRPILTLNNNHSMSAFIWQKALETPLPATPLHHTHFDHGPGPSGVGVGSLNGESHLAHAHTAGTSAIGRAPDMLSDSFSDNQPPSTRIPPLNVFTANPGHQPHIASSLDSPASGVQLSPLEEPMTPTRHHYAGRPLPRPPPTHAHTATAPRAAAGIVDSTYAAAAPWTPDLREGADKDEHPRSYTNTSCPEGLLIDLEDTTLDYSPISGPSTPRSDSVENLLDRRLSSAMAQSASSVNLVRHASGSISGRGGAQDAGTPFRSLTPSPVHTPQQQQEQGSEVFSEFTDLDLLLARVAERAARDGTDYETLLMVSELIGPATPPRRRSPSPSSSAAGSLDPTLMTTSIAHSSPTSNGNTPLIGRIEYARRRQTQDGRVKVKIKLFGVSVDKCAICLSQFKDGEMAVLTSVCQHAFHEPCVARWLLQAKSCPVCRVPLDTDMDMDIR